MNILFTCAGRRNYLINYFKEAINGRGKIFAADKDMTATAMVDADVALQVPDIYDETYIDKVLGLSIKHKINAIISLNDLELPLLAAHKTRFNDHGVKILISDSDIIQIAFDKYETHKFIEKIGLNSPMTFISMPKTKKALESGEINFPLILKPRWGSASIGIEFAYSQEELELTFRVLQIKLNKSILKQASSADSENAILIQELLPGNEYGMDVVNDFEGHYFGTFVRQKLNMRAGETDKAVSVVDKRFESLGRTIGTHLKHIGNLDCDVFLVDDRLYVIELNPRFGGGYPFSHEAGVNTAAIYISWLNNNKDVSKFNAYKANVLVTKCDRILKIKTKL